MKIHSVSYPSNLVYRHGLQRYLPIRPLRADTISDATEEGRREAEEGRREAEEVSLVIRAKMMDNLQLLLHWIG